MRVRTTETERTDARAARSIACGPIHRRRRDAHRDRRPVDMRRGGIEVRVTGDHALLQRQYALDHAGQPGPGFEMADIRLDRSDQQRRRRIAGLRIAFGQRLELDRVAQRRSGSMRLDIVDIVGIEPGIPVRAGDDPALGNAARRGQRCRAAILVDRRSTIERQDGVRIASRRVERLEHERPRSLGADIAAGGRIECTADAVGREQVHRFETREQIGPQQGIDAKHQRRLAFCVADRLAREMQRDERGGAGGIDREARPGQTEAVGQPPCRRRERCPGRGKGIGTSAGIPQPAPLMIGRADRDEHADVASGLWIRDDPRGFKRAPADLEQQPLLRIERACFGRGHIEKRSIEMFGKRRIEEAAEPAHGVLRRDRRLRPAPSRHRPYRRTTPFEKLPQTRRIVTAARIAARHTDDSDTIPIGGNSTNLVRYLTVIHAPCLPHLGQ